MPETRFAAPGDFLTCARMLRDGSRSFHAASRFLPNRVRTPATALYAFCRVADDAIDLSATPAASLERLRQRLDAIYAGNPRPTPADRVFADTIFALQIPRALPEALLEGFAWDVEARLYADLPALLEYAARVAGSVGAMMAIAMGVHCPRITGRACELGLAMQLSNIARDVGEDARRGRLYLPLDWLAAENIDPAAWLACPTGGPAIDRIVARLLDEAAALYARAAEAVAHLPADCRPAIHAARLLYAGIGTRAGRTDPVAHRARLPNHAKTLLLARAVLTSARPPTAIAASPPPEAVRFLCAAMPASPAKAARHNPLAAAWMGFDERVAWLVDLFTRLDARQQIGTGR